MKKEEIDFIDFVETHGFQKAGNYEERYRKLIIKRNNESLGQMRNNWFWWRWNGKQLVKDEKLNKTCPIVDVPENLSQYKWFLNSKYLEFYPKTYPLSEYPERHRVEGLHCSAIWIDEYKGNFKEEAQVKKAVFILQEATKDGVEGYIVKGWENVLRDDELPEEYFDRVPNFYAMDTKIILNYPYNIMSQLNEIYNRQQTQIIKDDFLSERDWKISLEFMLQAGHRLSKILEEQRKPKEIRFEI